MHYGVLMLELLLHEERVEQNLDVYSY
jgi:hypothetical protein